MEKALNSKWTLWYEERSKEITGDQWGEQQKQICTISTVKEFWEAMNNIKPAFLLPVNSIYHLFKEDITPSWEDPANNNGGAWRITIRSKDIQIQDKWLTLFMGLIGEQLDPNGKCICGGSVLVKAMNNIRLEIWLKECDNNFIATVGNHLRELKLVAETEKIDFIKHGEKDPYMTIA